MEIQIYVVLLLVLLTTISHGAEVGSRKLRLTEEDVELDRQLNILNKPPVKSFKSKDGEIIDCVDIYKQPAFDHPLLKDHKLQRKPSFIPEGPKSKDNSRFIKRSDETEFEGCPDGSVPFRRVQKEDLVRAKAVLDLRRPRSNHSTSGLTPEMHYAAVTTSNDPSRKIYGAKTLISVYNLTVQSPQLSEVLLWIGTGVDGPYNSIEYGWTVNPQLYGDSQTRTYSFWTADGSQNTGCYNALCPGYVQVSKTRLMGTLSSPVSQYGKLSYVMDIQLFKDPKTSNWWLVENLNDKPNEPVGYWPKELFPTMADTAAVVQVGGKVYSPDTVPAPTPMGSGTFILYDFGRTCFASNIQLMNSDAQYHDPIDVPMQGINDIPKTYRAFYLGDASPIQPGRGYSLLFGGPNVQ